MPISEELLQENFGWVSPGTRGRVTAQLMMPLWSVNLNLERAVLFYTVAATHDEQTLWTQSDSPSTYHVSVMYDFLSKMLQNVAIFNKSLFLYILLPIKWIMFWRHQNCFI